MLQSIEFKFRKPRETTIKEARESGNPIPVQRQPVTVDVPQYTAAELVSILQNPAAPEAGYIVSLVNQTVVDAVRQHFADDTIYPVSSEILDLTNYNPQNFVLSELAKEPESSRAEKVEITKEMLADFEKAISSWIINAGQFASMGADQRRSLGSAVFAQVKSGFRAIAANAGQLEKIRKLLTVFAENWLIAPENEDAPERDSVIDVLQQADAKIRRLLRAIEKRNAMFETMPDF